MFENESAKLKINDIWRFLIFSDEVNGLFFACTGEKMKTQIDDVQETTTNRVSNNETITFDTMMLIE